MRYFSFLILLFSGIAFSATKGTVSQTVTCENTNKVLCLRSFDTHWNGPKTVVTVEKEEGINLLTSNSSIDENIFIFDSDSIVTGEGYINATVDTSLPNNTAVIIMDDNTEFFSDYNLYINRLAELNLSY